VEPQPHRASAPRQPHLTHVEPTDPRDVSGVRGVERQPVREGGRCDERVEGAGRRAPARRTEVGGVPLRERDVIRVADLQVVSDQPLVGPITTRDAPSTLALSEPVLLEPGSWLFGFRVDTGLGDVDLLDLRVLGVQSGDEVEAEVPAGGRCDYTRSPDPYPDGAFYWRDGERGEHFIPAFAKVPECDAPGKYDGLMVMNPGDIALDLWGFPAG